MSRPLLLIHLARTVGHFTVYAAEMADWALARDWRVAFLGPGLERTGLSRFLEDGRAEFLDLAGWLNLDLPASGGAGDAAADRAVLRRLFSQRGVAAQLEALRTVQQELAPQATICLNSDDMLFNSPLFLEEDELFAGPTFAVSTFGRREAWAPFAPPFTDCASLSLARILGQRAVFAGVFSLDEHHVAETDPEQEYLRFLPDPYTDRRAPALTEEERERLAALEAFLDSGQGPVVPVLGKLDARKQAGMVLQAALEHGLACVVLGSRAGDDPRAEAALAGLRDRGLLFADQGYVPELFFRRVLAHPRTCFLPLAYSAHYGSSGIHLMAAELGVPCLVPDVGLTARRTLDFGLGRVFAHGDAAAFRQAFAALVRQPPVMGEAAGFFADHFSREALFQALDAALNAALDPAPGDGGSPARLPFPLDPPRPEDLPPHIPAFNAGILAQEQGDHARAAREYARALEQAPEHPALELRRAVCLRAAGQEPSPAPLAEVSETALLGSLFYDAVRKGFLPLPAQEQEDAARFLLALNPDNLPALQLLANLCQESGRPWQALEHLDRLLALGPPEPEYPLQTRGGVLAALKRFDEAARSFRQAMEKAPDFLELFLNLSDVLRYAGRLDEAEKVLSELRTRDPEYPGLDFKAGQVQVEQGEFGKALASFAAQRARGFESPVMDQFEARAKEGLSQ